MAEACHERRRRALPLPKLQRRLSCVHARRVLISARKHKYSQIATHHLLLNLGRQVRSAETSFSQQPFPHGSYREKARI